MTYTSASKLTAALVAFVMVVAPMSVMASHNSLGTDGEVAQATEFVRSGDDTGDLAPDVGEKLRLTYHGGSADQGLIEAPRNAPQDQRGTAYSPDECRTYGEDPTGYESELASLPSSDDDEVLTNPDNRTETSNCYIGYFDMRHQYLLFTDLGIFTGSHVDGSDDLYQVNPAPGDEYCTGQENPSDHAGPSVDDGGPVDQAVASANRSAFDSECDGSPHETYGPGYATSSIDTTLLEVPFQSDQRTEVGVTSVTGTEEGSGTLTLPFMLTRYIYVFGQPHPAIDSDDIQAVDERYDAGEGVFGPDPAAGGDPIRDISNACGTGDDRRTKDCKLLTPQDIRAYDDDPPTGEEDTARLCTYQPSYFSVDPGALTSGACGALTGSAVGSQYLPTHQDGGLGTGAGASTFLSLMPGWHGFAILVNHRSSTTLYDFACDGGSMCHDFLEDGNQYREYGAGYFAAVNPEVPDLSNPETEDLWCVRPNILTTSDDKFYADHAGAVYDADAIDSDRNAHPIDAQFKTVRDTVHDPIRDVLRPIQEPLPHHTEFHNPGNLNNPENIVTYEQIKDEAKDRADDQRISDAIERGDYVGTGSEETSFGETDPFEFTRAAGVGCTADGVVVDRATSETVSGDFRFDASVVRQGTVTLKDPTLIEDDSPAREDETQPGTWQGDRYDFSGSAIAQVDTSDDAGDEFSPCTEALGEPQPNRDFCVWFAAWDAYNSDCSVNETRSCGDQLSDRDYDLDTGVGLIVTIETTGPTLLIDEELSNPDTIQDRTTLIGDTQPTARNCIVGTSVGLNDRLGNFTPLVDDLPDQDNLFGLAGALCSDADGDVVTLADAFSDGSPGPDGGFGGAFDFVKFAPTPDAARDGATNGFGQGDQICVHGIWSVKDGEIADDTEGNLELGGGVHHYKDCDPLTSGPNEGDR